MTSPPGAFALPFAGGVGEGRGAFALPFAGGVGEGRGAFAAAFLAGDARAAELLPAGYRDAAARLEKVRRLAGRGVDPSLLEALRVQDRALPPSAARRAAIESLGRPGAVAVVTGQQVGLFLGPLFTFYKAATAVAVARALAAETGATVVPIFWLQTEDHDLPEIDHCHLPVGAGGPPLRLGLARAAVPTRSSVAGCVLGPEVSDQVALLEEALAPLPFAGEVLPLLRRAYAPGRRLAAAFAEVLAALFADEGLVLLDPRDVAVARLAAPIYRASIERAGELAELLGERGRALAAAGWGEQVFVRPGAPLAFFHDGAAEGPRYRLEPAGEAGRWRLAGAPAERTVSGAEIDRLLDEDPLRFSGSALLRPVVQDHLLPVAAYVGGPGEIAYFAQLAPLYAALGVEPSLVVPRGRFRLVDDTARSLLERLGLSAADAERPREALLEQLAASSSSSSSSAAEQGGDLPAPEVLRERLAGALTAELDGLESKVARLDVNLRDPVRRTREAALQAIGRLVERYARAWRERDRIAAERVDRLQAMLAPDGAPQERHYSLPAYACKHGLRSLKAAVLGALASDPYQGRVQDLRP